MSIELTAMQKKALEICLDHFAQNKDTVIAGYAGTGKSTLVRFLVEELENRYGLKSGSDIIYAAFTGKASQVLTNKGCPAFTLHKLMYDVHVTKDGDYTYELKEFLSYDLIIVDECSMVPNGMLQELRSFGIPIVFLGDPGQLPPIDEDSNNHLLDNPDIFLTEVLRQALDSPIIRLSMDIRNHNPIDSYNFEEAKVIHKKDLTSKDLLEADMILVGTNAMRAKVNKAMRAFLGKTGALDKDEKIICTHNYWDKFIETSITNGTVGILKEGEDAERLYFKGKLKIPVYRGKFFSESGLERYVDIDKRFLVEEIGSLSPRQEFCIKPAIQQPLKFTYAYAITGHKAQGSEWDNVIVFEESFPYGEDHVRWLYTCVTRARKKVILVRG